jgi:hypothetical protein
MNRVFPTGQCWCGCGETTPPTSFFAQGHDKRAEARVVKEIYGGVAEFLTAHGYGPDGRDPEMTVREGPDVKGLMLLAQWCQLPDGHVHVVLETLNPGDRSGPRLRREGFHPQYKEADRAFCFMGCGKEHPNNLMVAVPDIGWVYLDRSKQGQDPLCVVRLRGGLVQDPTLQFVSFGG